jgi:hypothetical protein
VPETPPPKNKRKDAVTAAAPGLNPAAPGFPRSEKAVATTTDRQSERPTVHPPFDVQAFARTTGATSPPAAGAQSTDEADASNASERITVTNEAELEMARAKSIEGSQPPRRRTSALLIADSLVSSHPPPQAAPSSIEAAVLGAIASSPAPEITERPIDDAPSEMRQRFSLGDYSGALELAELILSREPSNLEAAECGENCRSVLLKMYAAKIGSLDRIPMVLVAHTQMRWLSIDHRAGFVLSLIDGTSTVEMLLDVAGMPRLDSLRILHELVERRIVAFR